MATWKPRSVISRAIIAVMQSDRAWLSARQIADRIATVVDETPGSDLLSAVCCRLIQAHKYEHVERRDMLFAGRGQSDKRIMAFWRLADLAKGTTGG